MCSSYFLTNSHLSGQDVYSFDSSKAGFQVSVPEEPKGIRQSKLEQYMVSAKFAGQILKW